MALLSFYWLLASICVNTSNPGKLAEYIEYLAPTPVIAQTIDLQEPEADPLTIISYKASQFNQVLVDDVSLNIEGCEVGAKIKWVLKELDSDKYLGKACTYVCLIGFCIDDLVKIYKGEVQGQIVRPRGNCFGFGTYFLPHGSNLTLGEFMDPNFNARYLAVQKFLTDQPYMILPKLIEWHGSFQKDQ